MKVAENDVIQGLLARGVPAHVAQGVAMNFRDESAFNTGAQEQGHRSGRGGFGLAQWTGARRVALEQFAKERDQPVTDLGLQLDYFMHENAGPEAQAWASVLAATSPQDAAVRFLSQWERPAAQHVATRTAKYLEGAPMTSPTPAAVAAPAASAATSLALTGTLPAAQVPKPADVQRVFDTLASPSWASLVADIQQSPPMPDEFEQEQMEQSIAMEDANNRNEALARFFDETPTPQLVIPRPIEESINRYLAQL